MSWKLHCYSSNYCVVVRAGRSCLNVMRGISWNRSGNIQVQVSNKGNGFIFIVDNTKIIHSTPSHKLTHCLYLDEEQIIGYRCGPYNNT